MCGHEGTVGAEHSGGLLRKPGDLAPPLTELLAAPKMASPTAVPSLTPRAHCAASVSVAPLRLLRDPARGGHLDACVA